jgi:5-methylcytosine-specific restriction endonuclease McrA
MSLRLSPEEYARVKREVLGRDRWKCQYCGTRNNLHVHHIVYRSEQGRDTSDNLVTLCLPCHDGVHGNNLSIWAENEDLGANCTLHFVAAPHWRPGR